MSQADMKLIRTWRDIAEELSRETDPKRLIELTEELDKALEAEQRNGPTVNGHAA
ncbi:MAG TPA: hypothetical protein VFA89_10440 [Terriglobales bacterium]|nr:hypothetical protein [Terriglobales bacterium]